MGKKGDAVVESDVSGRGNISDSEESDTEYSSSTMDSQNGHVVSGQGQDSDTITDDEESSSVYSGKVDKKTLLKKNPSLAVTANKNPKGILKVPAETKNLPRLPTVEVKQVSDGELTDDEFDESESDDSSQSCNRKPGGSGNVSDNESSDRVTDWAATMADILKSKAPKNKKPVVLSEAMDDQSLQVVEAVADGRSSFEVVRGEVSKKQLKRKYETLDKDHLRHRKRKKSKDWECVNRVKPDFFEKRTEKQLVRIATKGVVQLLNAIQGHQKKQELEAAAKRQMRRPRDDFLKMINPKQKKNVKVETKTISQQVPVETRKDKHEPNWKVLQEDFLSGSSALKDWDSD